MANTNKWYFTYTIEDELLLIEKQGQTLTAIIWKTAIAGYKSYVLRNGMSNNDMITWILMAFLDVMPQPRVGQHVLSSQRKNPYVIKIFYGTHHFFGCLP